MPSSPLPTIASLLPDFSRWSPRALQLATLLAALLAGALALLAFAPFGWWPLQIAALALLFRLCSGDLAAKRAALVGLAFGFGWSVAGVYWLFVSMHRYGGLPSWMAALAVALMGLVLGSFAALAMGAGTWLRRRWTASSTVTLLLVFPATWALSEWLRGWVLTGFPWVVSGYAHTASPLAGYAPLVGVYGVGALAALIAGCVALLPIRKLPIALACVLLAAGWGLKTINWTSAAGQPISVRLLQGNVPQELKFQSEQIVATLGLYHDLIQAAPADLIATPETAVPLLAHQLPPDYLSSIAAFARKTQSHVTLGIPLYDGPQQYANSVIGLSPEAGPYRYDKHHLVPFGEFIPPGSRWFVTMMKIPLGDFTRGDLVQRPFAVNGQWVMPNICYEDLFGEEIAEQIAASHFSGTPQATILLNVSNIAWFGDTLALPQHLQISQMRALETGRPMLRATNTGITAVIDHKGTVVAQLPRYSTGTLAAKVQGYRGITPYILWGNTLLVAAALLMLGAAWLLSRKFFHSDLKNR